MRLTRRWMRGRRRSPGSSRQAQKLHPEKSGALMTHGGRRMQTSRMARTGGRSRRHRLHRLRRPDQCSQPKRLSRLSQPNRLQPNRLQHGHHVQRRPNSRETSCCRSSLYVPTSTAKATRRATASDTTTSAKACSVRVCRIFRVGIDADHAKRSPTMPEGWLLLAQQRGVCGCLRAVPHVPWPLLILNV